MSAVITDRLVSVARAAAAAGHGQKTALYKQAAEDLGISFQTLMRRLKDVRVAAPRKQRSDAGQFTLPREEAMLISAYLTESARRNGKRLAKVDKAVEVLRANDRIVAGRVDTATGEFLPLSTSAISKALYGYGLHPEQLTRPAPKISLAAKHPNHVWQDDPSLCVLYYLRGKRGLQAMPHDEFYKNKPKNLERIAQERVWRYAFVDHASGCIYLEYVLGAESGANHCHTFINALQARGAEDPFHGVPSIVMLDPGSANTGAMFQNLALALGIQVLVNKPGQPWAKGAVEKTNDIIEREFEQGLRFVQVNSLEELNLQAHRWMRHFNATAIHTRTRRTRFAVWQTIRAEQLRIAPSVDVCRALASCAPVQRKVSVQLEVSYRGQLYDVSGVPGVEVGEKLQVTRNPWRDDDSAHVITVDAEGHQTFHVVEVVRYGEYGYRESAQPIGEGYKRHADTATDAARKQIERLVMDASTDEEAAAKRKAKTLPFGGTLDPYKPIRDAEPSQPAYLPRRGTAMDVQAPIVQAAPPRVEQAPVRPEFPPLNHVEAARTLKPLVERAGGTWSAELYQRTAARWPDGLPVDQVEAWATELLAPPRSGLRVVGGAA